MDSEARVLHLYLLGCPTGGLDDSVHGPFEGSALAF